MYEKSKKVEEKIQRRSPKYCFQKNKKITYKVGKEIESIFNIPRYSDVFLFIKNMENNIREKIPFNIELNYITVEALKLYKNDYGDFSNLEKALGSNFFYLLNDISLYNVAKVQRIVDDYLNDATIERLNKFYNTNKDIVMYAFEKNCSSLYIFDIIDKNKTYKLLENLYNEIKYNKCNNRFIRNVAAKLILDFESKKKNITSEKGMEELYYHIEMINKYFISINFNSLKDVDISVDNIFDHISLRSLSS